MTPRSLKETITHSADAFMARIRNLFNTDLAPENDFLRIENKILRSKVKKRISLTDHDRRVLVAYGMRIKDRLHEVISIVKPETLLAWHRRMKKQKWTFDTTPKKPGRPKTSEATERLAVKLAGENNWGYTRIAGEMLKLGHKVSPTSVKTILKKHGLSPRPKGTGLSWKTFIQSHLDVTWAADFFTEEVWTVNGLVTFYVLFFIHLKTRRVYIAGYTPHPHHAWTSQQARNFSIVLDENHAPCRYLIHDRDRLFLPFDNVITGSGVRIVKTPPQEPMCNAFAERFVREARETLKSIIPLGEWHFRQVLKAIERHHNYERPHQGINNRIPLPFDYPESPANPEHIRCSSSLGGLLNHYYVDKKAA